MGREAEGVSGPDADEEVVAAEGQPEPPSSGPPLIHRLRTIAAVLLPCLALLPTLALAFFHYYEEDLLILLQDGYDWNAWKRNGRLVWYFIGSPLYGGLSYPNAHYVFQLLFFVLNSILFLFVYKLSLHLTGRRLLSVAASTLIFLHFIFAEIRFFNGNYANTALVLQLGGILMAIKLTTWLSGWRGIGSGAVVAAALCLLSFNAHQAGALVAAPVAGLLLALWAMKALRNPLRDDQGRVLISVCLGLLLGAALYKLQIEWTERTGGFVGRTSTAEGRQQVLLALASKVSAYLLSPNPHIADSYPLFSRTLLGLLGLGFLVGGRTIPIWKRIALLPVMVVSILLAGFGPVLGDGFFSARTQFGVVVGFGLWVAFLIANIPLLINSRGRGFLLGVVFLVAAVPHTQMVVYATMLRLNDKNAYHSLIDLAKPMETGESLKIDVHISHYSSRFFSYGDFGRSLFATPWGAKAIFDKASFSTPPLKLQPEVTFYGLTRVPTVPPIQAFAKRRPGQIIVDGNFLSIHQMRVEQRLLRPWRSSINFDIPKLLDRSAGLAEGGKHPSHWIDRDSGALVMRATSTGESSAVFVSGLTERHVHGGELMITTEQVQFPMILTVGAIDPEGQLVVFKQIVLRQSNESSSHPIPAGTLTGDSVLVFILKAPAPAPKFSRQTINLRGHLEVSE